MAEKKKRLGRKKAQEEKSEDEHRTLNVELPILNERLDSRLRGNDEVGSGNDEVESSEDEHRTLNVELPILNEEKNAEAPALQDRVMRYGRSQRNPACPECGAFPVVCMMRRAKYSKFRCRQCGHAWEVNEANN